MKIKRKSKTLLAIVVVLMLSVFLLPPQIAISQAGCIPGPLSGNGVQPSCHEGNPTCSDIDHCGEYSTKIEPVSDTYPLDGVVGHDVTIEITEYKYEEDKPPEPLYFDWTSTLGICAVIVKGGDDANVYYYDPLSYGDTNLHAPINPSGEPAGISHITFCYSTPQPQPAIDIEKICPEGPVYIGDTLEYTIIVTNTGDVTLSDIHVVDTKLGIDQIIDSLAPGASETITRSYGPVTVDDLPIIYNTATASSVYDEQTVEDTDSCEVEIIIIPQPAIDIEKTGDAGPVSIGDIINYTITVTNTGDVTLTNVTVVDTKLGIDENVGTLTPGASADITGTYGPVKESDLPGPIVNTASATSDQTPDPVEDDHSVPIEISPPPLVVKEEEEGYLEVLGIMEVLPFTGPAIPYSPFIGISTVLAGAVLYILSKPKKKR